MPRLQSLRGSFGSPPHKEPTLRGGLGGALSPRMPAEKTNVSK